MNASRNGLWNIVQTAVPMLSSAVFLFVLARVISIEEFGMLAYATSLVTFGVTIVTAGLNAIAVRELVSRPQEQGRILFGLVIVREAFALIAYGAIALISLTAGNDLFVVAVLVLGAMLFSRAADVPDFWYQAVLRSRVSATVRGVSSVTWLAVKLATAAIWPNVWVFITINVIEAIVTTIALYVVFRRDRNSPRLRFGHIRESFDLLRRSWPLILSSAADQVNTRSDVLLIQSFLGSTQVAFYAAAVRLSEMTYFLPNAFMAGTFASFIELRRTAGPDSHAYRAAFQRSLDRSFWLGVAVAVFLASLSYPLMVLLFGIRFADAAPVLAIHCLASPFMFMAAVGSKWIVAEGKLYASTWRHWAGAVLNVTLNLMVIPTYGIVGAAVVSVASYVLASYLSFLCTPGTFRFGVQMTLAIVWPVRALVATVRRLGGGR